MISKFDSLEEKIRIDQVIKANANISMKQSRKKYLVKYSKYFTRNNT